MKTASIALIAAVWASVALIGGCAEGHAGAADDAAPIIRHGEDVQLFPVWINTPSGPPRVETGLLDHLGRAVTVSCGSCHTTREPDFSIRSGEDLHLFHQGLHFAHGSLSCLSCHNPDNYNTLRLADGAALDYGQVMTMCAQCHSKQAHEYARGAHGGMMGYWDLTRGPRTRHSCIDCHDPHAPAFPHMVPTFKPRDRFLEPPHADGAH